MQERSILNLDKDQKTNKLELDEENERLGPTNRKDSKANLKTSQKKKATKASTKTLSSQKQKATRDHEKATTSKKQKDTRDNEDDTTRQEQGSTKNDTKPRTGQKRKDLKDNEKEIPTEKKRATEDNIKIITNPKEKDTNGNKTAPNIDQTDHQGKKSSHEPLNSSSGFEEREENNEQKEKCVKWDNAFWQKTTVRKCGDQTADITGETLENITFYDRLHTSDIDIYSSCDDSIENIKQTLCKKSIHQKSKESLRTKRGKTFKKIADFKIKEDNATENDELRKMSLFDRLKRPDAFEYNDCQPHHVQKEPNGSFIIRKGIVILSKYSKENLIKMIREDSDRKFKETIVSNIKEMSSKEINEEIDQKMKRIREETKKAKTEDMLKENEARKIEGQTKGGESQEDTGEETKLEIDQITKVKARRKLKRKTPRKIKEKVTGESDYDTEGKMEGQTEREAKEKIKRRKVKTRGKKEGQVEEETDKEKEREKKFMTKMTKGMKAENEMKELTKEEIKKMIGIGSIEEEMKANMEESTYKKMGGPMKKEVIVLDREETFIQVNKILI